MIFEIVLVDSDVIIFDEKIVARNRDAALIELGRRLEQEEIESDGATVTVREFTPTTGGQSVSGLTLRGTSTVNPLYVSNTGGTTFTAY